MYWKGSYRSSGNFHGKSNSRKKICIDKFSQFVRSLKFFYVKCFIRMLNFRSGSQLQNNCNSEIFPIYGILKVVLVKRKEDERTGEVRKKGRG